MFDMPVGSLCTRSSKPTSVDWQKALQVVKYLLGRAEEGIEIHPQEQRIEIFTDAGEGRLEDKATIGILISNGDTPILWLARKQDVTVLPFTGAEYIAPGHATNPGTAQGSSTNCLQ